MNLSKAQNAYRLLRDDILNGRLVTGAALTVSSLKDRYQLGWTPLRDALSRLEQEHLVTFEQNKGYRVAGVSAEELLDLQTARKAVETAMFVASIKDGDVEWEQQIVATHYSLERAAPLAYAMSQERVTNWEKRHHAFHRALLAGSKSAWLHRFSEQIADQLHRHQRAMVIEPAITSPQVRTSEEWSKILASVSDIEHHTKLMNAALDRDSELAEKLLSEHVDLTLTALTRFLTIYEA